MSWVVASIHRIMIVPGVLTLMMACALIAVVGAMLNYGACEMGDLRAGAAT